jgi:hypothetical protein
VAGPADNNRSAPAVQIPPSETPGAARSTDRAFLKQASPPNDRYEIRPALGADGKGFRRILAPNGICVLGTWEITSENPYTGYYQKGAKGLTIGRISSDGNETKRGQRRSISLGMKIYPTMDP